MSDADAAAWRALAERVVGAGVESLTSRTDEGLAIQPIYRRRENDPPRLWRHEPAWSVAQRSDHPDPEAANRLALLDLEGGVGVLVLVGDKSPFSRGFGQDLTAADLDLRLEAIELDFIGLRIDAGEGTADALGALADLVTRRRLTSAALAVDIGYDPIGWQARLGRPIADDTRHVLDLRGKGGLSGTAFLADGRIWHEAGAGEAQELAAVVATALAYLRRQETLGLPLDEGRAAIGFLLTADADLFLGLAKFRAIRRLWARVESASGLAPKPIRLHAETSWRMMTRHDPWTNVMRATAATFAAGLGGADVITLLPFTLPLGLPDAAARRLARNLQHVLLHEAHLGKVADPAAGAGAFETLTDDLCRSAWALFQEIEREGGIETAIASGSFADRIAGTARTRTDALANTTRGIIGTTCFVDRDAPQPVVLDVAPRPPLETGASALPALRDAAAFEA